MKTVILALSLFIYINTQAQTQQMEPLVHVTGEGKISVVPDYVDIKVRVESQGKEAGAVKAENDTAIDKVINFLRSAGIKDKNIRTEYINLNKNYDYNTKTYNYTANQSLTIVLKDLDKYEAVMSGLLSSGINRMDGVVFGSSEMEKLKAETRVKAIVNAKEKATAYAEALGQSIGKAIVISESGGSAPQPPVYKARMMSMEASSDGGETIAPGELSIRSQVQVSFQLKM
ncbi:MAG: hypothetical protein ACI86L_001849 [Dokdonia sp.]|jgi:uncharacterized protein YggE